MPPLTCEQVAERLLPHRAELHALGVRTLEVFGSVARDEAREDSDVDLLVQFDEVPGFFGFVRLQHRLEEILGARVDLATRAALRPELRDRILGEARRVA